jgi:hypothetical protein
MTPLDMRSLFFILVLHFCVQACVRAFVCVRACVRACQLVTGCVFSVMFSVVVGWVGGCGVQTGENIQEPQLDGVGGQLVYPQTFY